MDGNVDLGPKLEQAVADLVDQGRYPSRDALLREGARLIHEREAWLADLQAKVEESIAQADAGQLIPIEQVAAQLKERYANWPPKPE
jgi:antitoxin ParD1/3/4